MKKYPLNTPKMTFSEEPLDKTPDPCYNEPNVNFNISKEERPI